MLCLENITVQAGQKKLVDDISLTLCPRKLHALIGPNGAGKSSLLRAVMGLLDSHSYRTSYGQVSLRGLDLVDIDPLERARMLAYMPQGQEIHWPMTVENIVKLGRHPYGGVENPYQIDDPVEKAMRATGVTHLKDRSVMDLSGGEKALVLLARCLCVGADVILVDEPIASLDPRHQLAVMTLLQQLAQQGKTILVVMHDLALASRFADHLILMDQGKIVETGSAKTVLSKDNLAAVYCIQCSDQGFDILPEGVTPASA